MGTRSRFLSVQSSGFIQRTLDENVLHQSPSVRSQAPRLWLLLFWLGASSGGGLRVLLGWIKQPPVLKENKKSQDEVALAVKVSCLSAP